MTSPRSVGCETRTSTRSDRASATPRRLSSMGMYRLSAQRRSVARKKPSRPPRSGAYRYSHGIAARCPSPSAGKVSCRRMRSSRGKLSRVCSIQYQRSVGNKARCSRLPKARRSAYRHCRSRSASQRSKTRISSASTPRTPSCPCGPYAPSLRRPLTRPVEDTDTSISKTDIALPLQSIQISRATPFVSSAG